LQFATVIAKGEMQSWTVLDVLIARGRAFELAQLKQASHLFSVDGLQAMQ